MRWCFGMELYSCLEGAVTLNATVRLGIGQGSLYMSLRQPIVGSRGNLVPRSLSEREREAFLNGLTWYNIDGGGTKASNSGSNVGC